MRTVHTSERTGFIIRSLSIPLSFYIGTRSSSLFLAIPIRDLVSLLELPSTYFSEEEIFEMFNHLNFFIIHCNSCIFPIFRSLVFFTFNFSNLAFPMMLTFQISLSASSRRMCTKRSVICISSGFDSGACVFCASFECVRMMTRMFVLCMLVFSVADALVVTTGCRCEHT